MSNRLSRASMLAAVAISVAPAIMPAFAHADAFTVTYLAPGVQTPAGITSSVETFNSPTYVGGNLTTTFGGSSVTGTYTGQFAVVQANQYGGAGGTGQYIDLVGPGSYTLSLSSGVTYLGLWFSALDRGNELQFYNGNNLVDTFLPSNYAQLVGVCPTAAPQPNYCGNPNANFLGRDAGEQFAYLNFYDTTSTFDSVVFTETVPGFGFESDNQAVDVASPVIGSPLGTTPEPASWTYLALAVLISVAMARRLGLAL